MEAPLREDLAGDLEQLLPAGLRRESLQRLAFNGISYRFTNPKFSAKSASTRSDYSAVSGESEAFAYSSTSSTFTHVGSTVANSGSARMPAIAA